MFRIILIGISLALDAMCVTIAIALSTQHRRALALIFKAAIIFALFQTFMPILGYFPARWITGSIDLAVMNIVAGIILAGVGVHMCFENIRSTGNTEVVNSYKLPTLLLLGVATSIDALAVGISFGCSGDRHIYIDSAIIGAITAIICIATGMISKSGARPFLPQKKSGVIGGAILILLGIKMFF